MKMKTLTLAIICTIPCSGTFAAAMDRSGQSISSFLQPNNYAEVGVSILDADVTGRESLPGTNRKIDDMADSYAFGTAAFKFQVNNLFSVGLIYDQPFGAKATYTGNNFLVSSPGNDTILPAERLAPLVNSLTIPQINNQTATRFNALTAEQRVGAALSAQNVDLTTQAGQLQFAQTLTAYHTDANTKATIDSNVEAGVRTAVTTAVNAAVNNMINNANASLGIGGTHVDVNTNNYSLIVGVKPIENFTVYAGPVYQTVKGHLNLRGNVTSIFNGYDAQFKETGDIGWLAGAAFEIPDIALKASLTYRSKIKHDVETRETLSSAAVLQQIFPTLDLTTPTDTRVETPQSINLDFQTGVMANTVAFANIRWVNWDSFGIRPTAFGKISNLIGGSVGRPNGFDVIKYADDQWSVNAGIGRKLNEKWAGTVSAGWDSGAGNPVSSLGPTEGFINVGVGVQYSPTPSYFVAGGVKYFWLGDAKGQISSQSGTNDYVAKFEDNNAIAYGLKLGYRF